MNQNEYARRDVPDPRSDADLLDLVALGMEHGWQFTTLVPRRLRALAATLRAEEAPPVNPVAGSTWEQPQPIALPSLDEALAELRVWQLRYEAECVRHEATAHALADVLDRLAALIAKHPGEPLLVVLVAGSVGELDTNQALTMSMGLGADLLMILEDVNAEAAP